MPSYVPVNIVAPPGCSNSSFAAYGHEVEMSVLGLKMVSTVYFFADPEINKNVLGRIGWLDRVRLALVDHDSQVFLTPYDQTCPQA